MYIIWKDSQILQYIQYLGLYTASPVYILYSTVEWSIGWDDFLPQEYMYIVHCTVYGRTLILQYIQYLGLYCTASPVYIQYSWMVNRVGWFLRFLCSTVEWSAWWDYFYCTVQYFGLQYPWSTVAWVSRVGWFLTVFVATASADQQSIWSVGWVEFTTNDVSYSMCSKPFLIF